MYPFFLSRGPFIDSNSSRMAWTFMTYIDWIIGRNMEAFSDIALL